MDKIVKIVNIDEGGFMNIDQFSDMIDVSKVEYYRLTPLSKENSLLIEFFDKLGGPITPGAKASKKASTIKRKKTVNRRKSA